MSMTLLLAAILGTSVSHAQFQPVQAADQQRVTVFSLDYEAAQFKALLDAEAAREQAAVSAVHKKISGNHLERAKVLIKSGHITKDAYAIAQFKHLNDTKEEIRHTAAADEALGMAELYKLQVLVEGNPDGADLREEIVAARLKIFHAKIAGLDAMLAAAQENERLLTAWKEHGHTLAGKKVMSDAEVDQRELRHSAAQSRVVSLRQQITLAQT